MSVSTIFTLSLLVNYKMNKWKEPDATMNYASLKNERHYSKIIIEHHFVAFAVEIVVRKLLNESSGNNILLH